MRVLTKHPKLIMLWLPVLLAALWVTAPVGKSQAADSKPKSPIEPAMEQLASTFRKLRRQISKPEENESTLKLIAQMQTAAVKAKSLIPLKVSELAAEKQPEALKRYRVGLVDLLTNLLAAEKAILESRNGDAVNSLKKLDVIKNEGHKALGVGS